MIFFEQHVYEMEKGDTLMVVPGCGLVALVNTDSSRFTLRLLPCHLPSIRGLVQELELIEKRENNAALKDKQPTDVETDELVSSETDF